MAFAQYILYTTYVWKMQFIQNVVTCYCSTNHCLMVIMVYSAIVWIHFMIHLLLHRFPRLCVGLWNDYRDLEPSIGALNHLVVQWISSIWLVYSVQGKTTEKETAHEYHYYRIIWLGIIRIPIHIAYSSFT